MRVRLGRVTSLVVLATLAAVAAASASDDGIFPFEYRKVELDNGLRAYLIDAGAPGQIAYVTMVRTGSRDEVEAGKTGFAHFFEHMMFRGTEKYPDFDAVSERMGADRNAFTSLDMTVYYLVVASDYLEQVMDLESDRFRNLAYDEAAFRTEAGAVLGEYQNSAYSPFMVLDRTVRETAFEEHTYRHQTIGYEADVRAMPEGYEYSRSFYQRHYRPENAVVVIAGDFDFDRAEELLRQYYTEWQPGYQAPQVPVEPQQTAPRRRQVEYQGRTLPILALNFKAPAWSATDETAVASQLLGQLAFGPNSDIYRKLVIEEQRVQFLQANFSLGRDPGLVGVITMVNDPADVEAVRDEILAAARQAREQLFGAERLADTKSNLKYGFLMGLETARSVAFSLIPPIINTGSLEAIDQYYGTLEGITVEDVQSAARSILDESRMTEVTLSQAGGES